MKPLLFNIILYMIVISCVDDTKKYKILKNRSDEFFIRKKIDIHKYTENFYIENEKEYVLRYHKIIGKDTAVIYFWIDSDSEYFIQANEVFFEKELEDITEIDD